MGKSGAIQQAKTNCQQKGLSEKGNINTTLLRSLGL